MKYILKITYYNYLIFRVEDIVTGTGVGGRLDASNLPVSGN